jgi:hypothetical protein
LAIASSNGHNFLYAADGGPNRKIDVYGGDLKPAADFGPDAFVDPKIPNNFTPYGIQTVTAPDGTDTVWVTYTALNKAQGGFVDAFTPLPRLAFSNDIRGARPAALALGHRAGACRLWPYEQRSSHHEQHRSRPYQRF